MDGRLSRLLAVAANTYRETVRERVLYNLVFFAIVMTISGLLMKPLSIRQDEKIIKDLGLAAMEFFGIVIAVILGAGLVAKEIEKRSLYPLLAKPLSRDEFFLGKFTGLAFTLLVNVSVMTAGIFLTLWATGRGFEIDLLKAVWPLYLSFLVIVALTLFFSTITSPALTAIFSVCVIVAGRYADVIRNMHEVVPGAPGLARSGHLLTPSPTSPTSTSRARSPMATWFRGATSPRSRSYGVAYIALLLVAGLLLFRRREFV